jgi:dTDP-4-dehydrorhamnose 3,5-epimerase
LIWSDQEINIPWPVENPNLSSKDKELPSLSVVHQQIIMGW